MSVTAAEAKIDAAWEISWTKFFRAETNLFYDWLSSYEKGLEQEHLPRPHEVQQQYPNPCGWGTGMEDSMISAGVMLSMICDQWSITREAHLREAADKIFRGMCDCARVHGIKGFVARSICLFDRKSIYHDSSRDQYTHYVHGLWCFYHSALVTESQKREIRKLLEEICVFVEKCVTPENDYYLNRADGHRGLASKMWEVEPHEAGRLPMIYAAGWDITGDIRWKNLYRKYAWPAALQSLKIKTHYWSYAILQMQCSLELLYQVENEDIDLKNNYRTAMMKAAEIAEFYGWQSARNIENIDITALGKDWRYQKMRKQQDYLCPEWDKDFLSAMICLRESFEAPLIQMLCPKRAMSELQLMLLEDAIQKVDPTRHAGYGLFYLQAAYWRGRKNDLWKDKKKQEIITDQTGR